MSERNDVIHGLIGGSAAATRFVMMVVLLVGIAVFFILPLDLEAQLEILNALPQSLEPLVPRPVAIGSFVFAFLAFVALCTWYLNRSWGSSEKVKKFLGSICLTLSVVGVLLLYEGTLYRSLSEGYKILVEQDGGLKELFALEVTLFAFLAGFVLLNTLPEFGDSKKNSSDEIQRWTNMHALLRFFRAEDGVSQKRLNADQKKNEALAKEAMTLIEDLKVSNSDNREYLTRQLDAVYQRILKLQVCDDNDHPALFHLVDQYTKLRFLLIQRGQQANESPNKLLLAVLTIVAIVTLFFAANAAFLAMTVAEDCGQNVCADSIPARLGVTIGLFFIVLPIVIILTTINDLRDHYSGIWSVNFEGLYAEMGRSLKLSGDQAQSVTPDLPNAAAPTAK